MKKGLKETVVWRTMAIALLGSILIAPQLASAFRIDLGSYFVRYPSKLVYRIPARDLNGIALNGESLNERFVTGISLDDVVLNGKKTASLDLKGTKLKHLNQLEGALMIATLDDGQGLTVRIDAVEPKKDRVDPDVIHYFASYETDDGWQPLCGVDDSGDPVGAIPLLGRWDYTQGTETGGSKIDDDRVFTFACDGYVLHKCVDAGYKPWENVQVCKEQNGCETVSLSTYHQACTRMLRADFCGDGVSYTVAHTVVSMYDGLGIRYDSEPWQIEAEWDEDGAVCVRRERVEDMAPSCIDYLADDTCGDPMHFEEDVLLISELPQD